MPVNVDSSRQDLGQSLVVQSLEHYKTRACCDGVMAWTWLTDNGFDD